MRPTLICLTALLGLFLPLPASAGAPRSSTAHSRSHRAVPLHNHARAEAAAPTHRTARGSRAARTIRTVGHRRHKLSPRRVTTTAVIPELPLRAMLALPPMKGSRESLVRQNERSAADGLQRIEDDDDMLALRKSRQLVAVPVNSALRVDERLPANRRYCRAWTARFLSDIARIHYARFHHPLQVNSAVRTVAYQRRLLEVNGNAAPADGDIASPHLTGATVDIAKKGLSVNEVAWMRAFLLPLQTAGKIDVEEEFMQSCFHITVYKSYAPGPPVLDRTPSQRHHAGGTLLAARVR